jgi:hypothetical protein
MSFKYVINLPYVWVTYILKIENKFAKFLSHLAIETTSEITSFLNFWWGDPGFMTNKLFFKIWHLEVIKNSSVRCKFPKPKCRYLVECGT